MIAMLLPFAVLLAAPLAAQVITVTIPCDLDATLYEDATGSLASGQGTTLHVGVTNTGLKRRALVRFSVPGWVLPPNARVISARLRLDVVGSGSTVPAVIRVHSPTQGWSEGASVAAGTGGAGAPAQPGDATWLHTSWPTTLWGTPGGSFVPTPSLTMTLPASGVVFSDATTRACRDVEMWMTAPLSPPGWLLIMDDEVTPGSARRIASREAGANGPALLVTCMLPGTVATAGGGCASGLGTHALAVQGTPLIGNTLQLQQVGGMPLAPGALFFDVALLLPGVPLGGGCSALLTPGLSVGALLVLDAQGAAATPLFVPPGIFRERIVLQAAALAATPLGFSTSNAAMFVTN